MNDFEYAQMAAKFEEAFGIIRSAYTLSYSAMGKNTQYDELRKICEEVIRKIQDNY